MVAARSRHTNFYARLAYFLVAVNCQLLCSITRNSKMNGRRLDWFITLAYFLGIVQAYLGTLILCPTSNRCVVAARSRHTNFYERLAYFLIGGLLGALVQGWLFNVYKCTSSYHCVKIPWSFLSLPGTRNQSTWARGLVLQGVTFIRLIILKSLLPYRRLCGFQCKHAWNLCV